MVWILIVVFVVVLGLFIAYTLSPAAKVRKQLRAAYAGYYATLSDLKSLHDSLRDGMAQASRSYANDVRAERLRRISINEFKKQGNGFRLAALRTRGLNTLADLQGWNASRLEGVRGIGPDSAFKIARAITTLTNESNAQPVPYPTAPYEARRDQVVLKAICLFRRFESETSLGQIRLEAQLKAVYESITTVARSTSFPTWLVGFGKGTRTVAAIEEATKLFMSLANGSSISNLQKELSSELTGLRALNSSETERQTLVNDLDQNQPYYQARFSDLLGKNGPALPPPLKEVPAAPTAPITVTFQTTISDSVTSIPPRPSSSSSIAKGLQATKFWIPAGTDVTVQGHLIKGGMVYVGSGLSAAHGFGAIEPALIDPSLQVASQGNCHEKHTHYWPSYSSIDPVARTSYLQWLSSGKCDPECDAGYLFIALYGLERRILLAADPASDPEIPLLEAEIARLLGIYGPKSYSFRSYATSLLEFSWGRRQSLETLTKVQEPILQCPFVNSLALKTALGTYSKSGRPLPANWALAWVLWAREIEKPGNLGKCLEPFAALFSAEYQKKFGEGMKLPESITRVTVTHKQASASFSGMQFSFTLDLPDITVLARPLHALKEIAAICLEQIDSYRRYTWSHPEVASALEGFCLLPVQLWPASAREEITKIQFQIESKAGKPCVISLSQFVDALGGSGRLKTRQLESIGQQLAALNLGIEPDVRFGAPLPKLTDTIAFFMAEGLTSADELSQDFWSAETLVALAAAVVCCGNGVNDQTTAYLLNHLRSKWNLSASELARFEAQLAIYSVQRVGNGPIREFLKEADKLGSASRDLVCNFLVLAALADGVADPAEVKVLEKIYQGLGLDRTDLYGRIHSASQAGESRTELTVGAEFTKPATQSPERQSVPFDLKKIAALRADSAKVSALLGEVFSEPEENSGALPKSDDHSQQSEPALLGLDTDHAALLNVLIERAQWTRAEIEEICSDRGLMVDGAIERINEAAFDQFDCAILEGDDPIDVSLDLIQKELTA